MTRVALVHDWLTGMRGGEYVLEAIAELFPKAELFTLLHVPNSVSPTLTAMPRHTSWLQKLPQIERKYRHLLPILPAVIEKFDLSQFDLVISSSHCVAKGVRKAPGAVHISYVHAPMRYMWDRFDDYFGEGRSSFLTRTVAKLVRPRLQKWDRKVSTPDRIDSLIANSRFIADQIKDHYQRDSQVIYPFGDLTRFQAPRNPGPNYLMVTAFAPYKKVDIAIEAFNRMKLPLMIVGGGQDKERISKIAGPTVTLLGSLSNKTIADLYSKCRAFIFPGIEDFGITPLEAMGAGAPVIAYGAGGALETVTPETGIFFESQTVESLMGAVQKMEKDPAQFSEAKCRKRAAGFSKTRFQNEFTNAVMVAWKTAGKNPEDLRFPN